MAKAKKNTPNDNFFKKVMSDDEIQFHDDSISFINKTEEEVKFKKKREIQIFNTILQQRNWGGRHLELIGEYRQMDNNFPIISAALKIFTQEACITGDSKVLTPMGLKRVDELYALNNKYFLVRSINYKLNVIDWSECKGVISKGKKEVYEVFVGNNKNSFKCTADHLIKTKEGFTKLENLKEGDYIGTGEFLIDPSCGCKIPKIDFKRIVDIIPLGEELVYDLVDVEPHNSFLVQTSQDNYVNVHNCTRDAEGNVFKIHSDNEKVKQELDSLFFDQLRINTVAPLIAKSFVKFGNHFCFLQTRAGEGVIDLMHFAPEHIRMDIENRNIFSMDNFNYKFQMGAVEFEQWEIAHWRLVTDVETLPYGQSILRSIVDTYRRVVMMRDALIVYRITRAPQRFLFKIDTSMLDPDAAELHAKEIKKQLAKKPLVNPQTGELDFKFSPISIMENLYMETFPDDVSDVRVLEGACLTGDTVIRTTNGFMSLYDLHEYFLKSSKKIYTLSINSHGNEVTGKINWCAETKKVNRLYEVIYRGFDGETYSVKATDNHPFKMADLTYKRADQLRRRQKLKGIGNFNYQVIKINIIDLEEPVSVFDLEVEEYHNFSLKGGAVVHNSNIDQVEDYKIIKDDLFAGLMIPKQYLQFDDVQTAKAALVQEDIRFANLIKEIQSFFVEGILHIAVVHLHAKGYSKEDMSSFKIEMNTNSTFAEKTRKELLEQRFAIAQMAWSPDNEGLNFMSFTQVLKEILLFSDNQVQKIIQDQFVEKKLAWRLANLSQNGFYESTAQDKKEEEEKKAAEAGVFKNLQFESAENIKVDKTLAGLIDNAVMNEINLLLKPVIKAPRKKQIITLLEGKFEFDNKVKERILLDKELFKNSLKG